jgi:subtilisin
MRRSAEMDTEMQDEMPQNSTDTDESGPGYVRHSLSALQQVGEASHGDQEKGSWGFEKLGIQQLWAQATGKGITIAILDSGIQPNHPDLQSAVDLTIDKSYNDSTSWHDVRGHGTHCIGTIAARRNGLGALGIAPDCRVIVGKVVNDEYGSHPDYLADGIVWAADHGVHIISMSMGFSQSTQNLDSAVQYAYTKNVVLVAAGGNNDGGVILKDVLYPAASPHCIAVGCVDENNGSGGVSVVSPKLDIVAPGIGIYSADIAKNNFYANRSGTSMAAAFVSGVIALGLEVSLRKSQNIDPNLFRDALKKSARKLDSSNSSNEFKCGLINPSAFLSQL